MKYEAILFDLDGTLMPMSNETFLNLYIPELGRKLKDYVAPETLNEALWASLGVMLQDVGDKTNEMVFFENFRKRLGNDLVDELEPLFYEFYDREFEVLKQGVGDNSVMVEAVSLLKEKGYRLVVATNPMFPENAVLKRLEFSGLDPKDFEFISNYTLHTRCKPNPDYYQEVLDHTGLKVEHCLMVGNDAYEDAVVREMGMHAWLLTDYLIEGKYENHVEWKGSRLEFLDKVKEVL